MGLQCWGNQGLGECKAAAACRWLQDDVYILRATEAVREMNVSGCFGEARHVISISAELL